ncbi:hypothetical protein ACLOJK_025161 [Asimina triloba]
MGCSDYRSSENKKVKFDLRDSCDAPCNGLAAAHQYSFCLDITKNELPQIIMFVEVICAGSFMSLYIGEIQTSVAEDKKLVYSFRSNTRPICVLGILRSYGS